MEQERKEREGKHNRWKIFGDDDWVRELGFFTRFSFFVSCSC